MEFGSEQIECYLLGKLDESDTATFEDQMFTDDQLVQQCRAMEDKLIEGYIRNHVSGDDLDRFRARFLQSPGLRLRIEIAEELLNRFRVQKATPEARPGWLEAFRLWIGAHPATVGTACAGCIVLAVLNAVLIGRLASRPPDVETSGSFTIAQGVVRTSAEKVALIPWRRGANQFTLMPSFAIAPGRYGVVLKDAKGFAPWKMEWTIGAGNPQASALQITVPDGVLEEGAYVLQLSAIDKEGRSEPPEEYPFRVMK